MSKPPDLDGLAKQYLDLWQQQLGGIAEDDQATEIMARTVELMTAGASTFAAMAAAAQGTPPRGDDDANARPSESRRSDGRVAPSPAATPVASDHDLAEFARRLERIEERLNTLEAASRKSRRKSAKKS